MIIAGKLVCVKWEDEQTKLPRKAAAFRILFCELVSLHVGADCAHHARHIHGQRAGGQGLAEAPGSVFCMLAAPPMVNECVMNMKLPKKPKNLGKHSPSITQRFNAAKWFNDKEGVTVKYKAGPGLQQRLLSRLRNPKWIPGRSTMPGCGVLAWSSYTVITVQQSWNLNDSGLSPFKQQKEGQFL